MTSFAFKSNQKLGEICTVVVLLSRGMTKISWPTSKFCSVLPRKISEGPPNAGTSCTLILPTVAGGREAPQLWEGSTTPLLSLASSLFCPEIFLPNAAIFDVTTFWSGLGGPHLLSEEGSLGEVTWSEATLFDDVPSSRRCTGVWLVEDTPLLEGVNDTMCIADRNGDDLG